MRTISARKVQEDVTARTRRAALREVLQRTASDFQNVLTSAEDGGSPNNLSTILKYSLEDGVTMLWMGDLETDFMKTIEYEIELPYVDAAHHGRARMPSTWMAQMDPKVVVLGEAPPEHLECYPGRDHIRQNATGDITFDCVEGMTHRWEGIVRRAGRWPRCGAGERRFSRRAR